MAKKYWVHTSQKVHSKFVVKKWWEMKSANKMELTVILNQLCLNEGDEVVDCDLIIIWKIAVGRMRKIG